MAEVGEVIQLGQASGTVVAQTTSANGRAQFSTSSGVVTGYVYQARNPDVNLDEIQVCLVEEQEAGRGTGRYALMVDDPYWGRRIQPAQFGEAPCTETFVMGYRLTGIIQRQGVPVAAAPVSFEVTLQTAEDGEVRFWDSEEYNPLVWSDSLQTYVTGSLVTAPVVTDANGRWEYLVPKGHGALYQRLSDRRDDTPETAAESLPRYVSQVCVAYQGREMPVVEGTVAILNLQSAQVQITATPGAAVSVGVMEDAGNIYTVPPSGVLQVGNLPEGWVSLAQFKQTYGQWDPSYGGQRAKVAVHEGQTTTVDLGTLEQYPGDGSVACGRVFLSPGVPAAGVQITIISMDSARIIGTAATTDGSGFWRVVIGDQGLGGNLFITDPTWGTMPVVGLPYSDVVLGARAYSGWMDDFKPESWRTGTFGHKNFPYVEEAVWVVDNDTGAVYPTQSAPYGGWMTEAVLPKWKYLADPVALLRYGPQLKSYRLETDCRTEDPNFHLRDQSFSGGADQPGYFRASGYYPEKKILVGGKIKYNVVLASEDRIDENWPEAARVGLEFGRHQPFVELRAGDDAGGLSYGCVADWLCPYCGGPVARWSQGGMIRGYCRPCAEAFGIPQATDGRTFARSMTLPAQGGRRWEQRAVALTTTGGFANLVRYHWRPDLYEENDSYLRDDGPGMTTNAPRWWARHPHELAGGLGLGSWDGDGAPQYVAGWGMAALSALMGRSLGLAQFKLAFPPGWAAPQDFVLEVDCEREDGVVETATVSIGAGTQGPNELHPLGDVVLLRAVPKLQAEGLGSPYAGVGLYRAVRDIRLVGPERAPGCQCVVTADVPFLHDPQGLVVLAQAAEFVALQLVLPGKGGCCLYIDPFDTFYRLYTDGFGVYLRWSKGENPLTPPILVAMSAGAKDFSMFWRDGRLYLRWLAGGTWFRVQTDDGVNFGTVSITMGLTHLRSWSHYGTEYMIGYDKSAGLWYCEKYDAISGTAYAFTTGANQMQIVVGDDQEAGLWGNSAGWIYADISVAGVITRYVSHDGGSTWAVVV